MRQFKRIAILRVGADKTFTNEYSDFRISFKFEKNIDSNPNSGVVKIYNLNQNSRAKFEAKNAICSLMVGYENSIEQVFIGSVSRCFTTKKGIDSITEIEVGDGTRAFQNAKIDINLPPGTTTNTALNKAAESLTTVAGGGVTAIKSFLLSKVKSFGKGLIMSGSAKGFLDVLTKSADAEWSIQDGEVQILEKGKATLDSALLLTPTTGLVGSPGKLKTDTSTNESDAGIEFYCLLQPKLKPGKTVKIESSNITGDYRVTKVIHEGDNFIGNWLTKCEAYVKK